MTTECGSGGDNGDGDGDDDHGGGDQGVELFSIVLQ